MTPRARKRTSAVAGVLILVALVAIVAGLVVVQYAHYQPEPAEAQEHPAVGSQPCTSCKASQHDYAHEAPYNDGTCGSCHTTSSWRVVHYTHENADFNVSFHAIIGCERCHTEGEEPISPDCETCHAARSPHGVGPVACAPCHTAVAWSLQRAVPEGHLSLEGGHEGVSCFECHTAGVDPDAPDRGCVDCHGVNHGGLTNCEDCHEPSRGWDPLPGFDHSLFFKLEGKHTQADCADCHKNNTFAGTPTVCLGCHTVAHTNLTRCEDCHTPFGFVPSTFDHDQYFKITGGHAKLACQACHPKGVYNGTPTVCTGCHGTAHGGLTACQDCHTTAGFKPSTFDHDQYFKITGGHAKLACQACHPKGVYNGTPTVCTGCHGTAHGGLTACQDCHTTAGFVPSTFDHDQYFKITGGHAKLACQACHPKGVYNGTPTVCTGCHGTAHGGLTACQDCHTTAGFKPSTFVHSTKFELVGIHADLGCNACHPDYKYATNIGDGTGTCDSCHDGPHGVQYTDCEMCHTPSRWSTIILEEHPGEIKLGAAHSERPCTLCHPTLRFTDDAPRPCEDCHLDDIPHVGPVACLDCHRPTTWPELHFTHPGIGVHEERSWLNQYCLRCHPGPDFTRVECTSCHIFVDPGEETSATPFPIPSAVTSLTPSELPEM